MMGIPNITDVDWLDRPKTEAVQAALHELASLRAIDATQSPTLLGKCMSLIPTEPIYSKLVLTALLTPEFTPVLREVVAIVAMICAQHVFYSNVVRQSHDHRPIHGKAPRRQLRAILATTLLSSTPTTS